MKSAVIRLGAVACLLGFAVAAQAQRNGVSWTYVEAAFQGVNVDLPDNQLLSSGDVDGNGGKIAGALQIQRYVHLLGSFERLTLDDIVVNDPNNSANPPTMFPVDDVDTWAVGFGFNTAVIGRGERQYRGGFIDRYSLFVDGQYMGRKTGGSNDPNGLAFDVGFRSVNFTRMESLVAIGYEKFDRQDGEMTLEGRLMWSVLKHVQVGGGVDWSDDITRYFINVRGTWPGFSIF
jgi:hypothetical protein